LNLEIFVLDRVSKLNEDWCIRAIRTMISNEDSLYRRLLVWSGLQGMTTSIMLVADEPAQYSEAALAVILD
jgi:hypothetical protein